MSVIPERKDFKKVSPDVAGVYPSRLVEHGYELVSTVKSTEKSHFDRYGLVKKGKRVVVVYDVKAQMLSVTAFDEFIGEVCSVLDAVRNGINVAINAVKRNEFNSISVKPKTANNQQKSVKDQAKERQAGVEKSQNQPRKKVESGENKTQNNKEKQAGQTDVADRQKTAEDKASIVKNQAKKKSKPQEGNKDAKAKKPALKQAENKPVAPVKAKPEKVNKADKAKPQNQPEKSEAYKQDVVATKGDFTLKKYSQERFDNVLGGLKQSKIKAKQKQAKGANNGETVQKFELSEGSSKITVCFTADKGILQIQGKPSDLLSKAQTLFSEGGDFKTTVNAHIEQKQSQDKASDVERRLKKYLPTGVLYLSSQAKIDFSIGIIDLLSSDTVLSDYSSLLIPPYRGLEMLIFDLQKAQGIKVKMIGQAFEKTPTGEYTLKNSYRKRIGSVIFNEVMTALYVEYNSTRNFYVHSALGSGTKVISDKNQAKAIYEKMLSVVEYNAKKLKEIHFSI